MIYSGVRQPTRLVLSGGTDGIYFTRQHKDRALKAQFSSHMFVEHLLHQARCWECRTQQCQELYLPQSSAALDQMDMCKNDRNKALQGHNKGVILSAKGYKGK